MVVDEYAQVLKTPTQLITNLQTRQEVELKFTAPHSPGKYCYCLVLCSDSYVDCRYRKILEVRASLPAPRRSTPSCVARGGTVYGGCCTIDRSRRGPCW